MLHSPLFYFPDFAQFVLPALSVDFILKQVASLLLFSKLVLVNLEKFLSLLELSLLLLELLSHSDLSILLCKLLFLTLLEGTQNGILVEGGPFIDLVIKTAQSRLLVHLVKLHLLNPKMPFSIFAHTEVLLKSLAKESR